MPPIQTLKDTFYGVLRDRIAAANPARTIVVRGLIRPSVLVVENELPGTAIDGIAPADTFCLRWTGLTLDAAAPLVRLACEIRYASDGTPGNAGMDRGRALAAMDAELDSALTTLPMNAPISAFAEIPGGGSSPSTLTGTNIFWTPAVFDSFKTRGERIERIASVEVFGYAH